MWISMIGLPHYLWSKRNRKIYGRALGEGLIELERGCIELTRMNLFRLKIRIRGRFTRWGPMLVTDGRDSFLVIA